MQVVEGQGHMSESNHNQQWCKCLRSQGCAPQTIIVTLTDHIHLIQGSTHKSGPGFSRGLHDANAFMHEHIRNCYIPIYIGNLTCKKGLGRVVYIQDDARRCIMTNMEVVLVLRPCFHLYGNEMQGPIKWKKPQTVQVEYGDVFKLNKYYQRHLPGPCLSIRKNAT